MSKDRGSCRRLPDALGGLGRAGDVGALAHYADASEYRRRYSRRRADVEYYVALARRHGGPVLDYGVGNGRVALEIARAGVDVVGVDLSRPMLADFREKLEAEPGEVADRVVLRQGDMRSLRLGCRFGLIIAVFNTVLHLYRRTDFERFFHRVHEHLEPRGRFVFDWYVPVARELARDPGRIYGGRTFRHPVLGEQVRQTQRFVHDPIRQVLLTRVRLDSTQSKRSLAVPLTQRQLYPQEVEALLHYNGFADIRFTADFGRGQPDALSEVIVASCRSGA